MTFQYVAYTATGQKVEGQIKTSSEKSAEESLVKQNYTIVSLKEVQAKTLEILENRLRTRDLIVFSRQLATLIESGIPIIRALRLLQEQMPNKLFSRVMIEIISDLQQGRFFSEAILRQKRLFPTLYGRLIEVGEQTGSLEAVLRQLATYMEKEEALIHKIRAAMSYPAFVFAVAIVVVFVMLTVALPPLMEMFKTFNTELPLPTRMLIWITNAMSTNKVQILAGVGLLLGAGLLASRNESCRFTFDKLLLKVPLLGRVIIQGAVARMCRSMSSLLQAGLALPEIIEMSIRTQSNRIIVKALKAVHAELLQGHGLADPLARQKIFPGMLVQMVRVGEETGALDTNMDTLAVFYEEEVDRAVAAMAGAMEPAMTCFIGGLVGFVAVAVIMPMYSILGAIK
jgi:type IV pilus assembly protein PilC